MNAGRAFLGTVVALMILTTASLAGAATKTIWPTQFLPVLVRYNQFTQDSHYIQLESGAPQMWFQAPIALPAGRQIVTFRFYCGTSYAGGGTLMATLLRTKLGDPVVNEVVAAVTCTNLYDGDPVLRPQEDAIFAGSRVVAAGYLYWVQTTASSTYNKIGAVQVVLK